MKKTSTASGRQRSPASTAKRRQRGTANELDSELRIIAIPLAREIKPGDSIAEVLLESMREHAIPLQAGCILVIKHKIISKAEGQLVALATIQPSAESSAWAKRYGLDARVVELALRESRRVLRRKNGVLVTETRHGFICANSGVDASNVDGGRHALLLPEDPDRSAARIRKQIKKRTGISIPVIITDSFGRPWREGLTEVAIGIAGMKPLRDDRGRRDPHGYRLRVSLEAVADELACAAGLVCGKLNRIPACVIRGYVYPAGRGSAHELLRPAASDLFR
jgi:coenzyme F420-0:L-glutamate ligase/coenzyme F420-1:gamma-L-glutamate ligase